jgi:hypothetical protein
LEDQRGVGLARHIGPAVWRRDAQGPWGGSTMSRARGVTARRAGSVVRRTGPIGQRRGEQCPWGGGATSRACSAAARMASNSGGA